MTIPRRVTLFLGLGLCVASQSGNIIRLGEASPVAMVAWRLLLATLLLAPLAGRDLARLFKLGKKETLLLAVTGVVMAAHFIAWVAAVQLTTVANAAVFFSFNPVLTATAAYFLFHERASSRLFISIGLGIAGVAIIGGGDLSFNREHITGDLTALLSALLFSVYFLLGKRLRRILPTSAYVTAVYGIATVVAFLCLLGLRLPVLDYAPITWLAFLLLALGPTMIGHTSFNHALRYIDAGRISAATVSEPLLAGIVAFFAWGEAVTVQTAAGYLFISASVWVLVTDWNPPHEKERTEP
jgi:drug/metabolite transporter (DMT)-like permease